MILTADEAVKATLNDEVAVTVAFENTV